MAGFVLSRRPFPVFPRHGVGVRTAGDALLTVQQTTTGKGAIVERVSGRDLGIEIWQPDKGAFSGLSPQADPRCAD